MTRPFLRKEPLARRRLPVVPRWVFIGLGALAFAMLDTQASVHVTRLTRKIQERKKEIRALESELAYLVRRRGAREHRASVIEALERDKGFAAPDAGQLVYMGSYEPPRRPRRR